MKHASSWFARLALKRKLDLAFLGVAGATVLMTGLAIAGLQWNLALQAEQQDVRSLGSVLAQNSRAAITFNDARVAESLLSALAQRPFLRSACLFSYEQNNLRLFASFPPKTDPQRPDCAPDAPLGNAFRISTPVMLDQELLGRLDIVQGREGLWHKLRGAMLTLVGILLLSLLIAGGLARWLQALIAGPVLALSHTAQAVAQSQDYKLRAPPSVPDEVGRLIDAFNDMLERIENTQEQLIQTEKLASLGGLVAGVAHEINTPVGVGVTAASTLHNATQLRKQNFERNELTATDLNDYFALAQQSSSIILNNLKRAADLIQSFKQVAVDQTSLEKREIPIKEYVEEVLLSLRPKLKKTAISVELQCPDDLRLTSFPGALAQVLTNLLMNALTHAYPDGGQGTIGINIAALDHGARIIFSDDGCGIAADALNKIFDPFYTTRRGEGGSGLGLHICHNLVTRQLKGSIHASSEPGQGTTFAIEIRDLSSPQEPHRSYPS